jgi:predicted  nucleic acid-binding Zn-ribbon protein
MQPQAVPHPASRSRDDENTTETPARPYSGSPTSGNQTRGRVQRRLCGQWLSEVGSRHLKRAHGITLVDYHRAVDEKRAAEADGRLSDGTPFFALLGEIAYDADEDKVQCHLCGDWFKWVGGLHLKYRHPDWRIADYRRAFNLNQSQVTMAAQSRQILRAIAIDRLKQGQIGSPLAGVLGLQHGAWRSLVDRRPDLAAELHPTRNGTLEPERLGVWSSERVWWRCARCGREWQTAVLGRSAQGGGCPDCGPRAAADSPRHRPRRPLHERSLAALRPDLVNELHPTRNAGLDPCTIGVWSRRRVWWRCTDCAHEWETTVMNRQQGNGCPRCVNARRAATYERHRRLRA